jgi:4-hydroxybenzoate polyprenyltransferase
MSTAARGTRPRGDLALFFSVSRFHIVIIAGLGTLTYGWLFAGVHDARLAVLAALDWWILDIGNKLSDRREDGVNDPAGARWVVRHEKALAWGCLGAFAISAVPTALYDPWLLSGRVAFQILGVLYNFPVLPGHRRFKTRYFWKNTMAGVLFLMSIIGYPLLALRDHLEVGPAYVALMAAFFFFLEHSFEILYDFKDVEGDRLHGVRTYPAVHGERGGILAFSAAVALAALSLVAGVASGVLGFREGIILFAPAVQAAAFVAYRRRGYRAGDTVTITHLGSIQLLLYNAYVWAGLPIPPW